MGNRISYFLHHASGASPTTAKLVPELSNRCIELLSGALQRLLEEKKSQFLLQVKTPLLPKPSSSGWTILDFNEEEIARQLILLDYNSFMQIQPTELSLPLLWQGKNRESFSPQLTAHLRLSNTIVQFGAALCILESKLSKRAKIFTKIIKICQHLLDLKAYSPLMALVSSLTLAPIHRMKNTWAEIPTKYRNAFDTIRDVVSPNRAYAALRPLMSNNDRPKLVWIGLYLTDVRAR